MRFTTLFFDLDDTLYPSTNGLWEAIRTRMTEYMRTRLSLPLEEVHRLRRLYFETYGTTLRGLQINHNIDAADYLAYVHDLPLQNYLWPDPELRQMLLSLPQRRWIFTNADKAHAQRVLVTLELNGCFEGVIDIQATGFHCKPDVSAYQQALALAGERDAQPCVLVDDSIRNLAPAHALGFTTILVSPNGPHPTATHTVARLHDLPKVMPALWSDSAPPEPNDR